MLRKIITTIIFFVICLALSWAFQLPLLENGFSFLKKVFALFDSAKSITDVSPPPDTARIGIPLYPPSSPTDTTSDSHHRIGAIEAWSRDDYPGIIDSLKKVSYPNDVDLRLLANLYYRLDSLTQALDVGEKIQDKDEQTLYALGLITMKIGDYKRATRYLQKAIDRKPNWARARARLADAYFLDNNHVKALSNWLLAKEGSYNEPYLNYFLGFIYFERGDYEEALNYFDQIKSDDPTHQLLIRAKYFQALIKEKTESREAAIEVLSEIEIRTIGMSEIEYDILKKKIYSHFWLGLEYYEKNSELAREHFINSEVMISSNFVKFRDNDKVIVELLKGVILKLREQLRRMKRYEVSNQYFQSYTNKKIDEYQSGKIDDDLMHLSGEVLYLCKEPILSARFFNIFRKDDPIAEMNYYVLQPNSMQRLPDLVQINDYADTLRPYVLFNYMSVAFQKGDLELADSFYFKLIESLNRFKKLVYRDNLLYHAHSYRVLWLNKMIEKRPEKVEELGRESERINRILNNMVRKKQSLILPMNSFYLSNDRLFIMAIQKHP